MQPGSRAWILGIFFILKLATIARADIPEWATKQLELRDIVRQCVIETQKWQNDDGSIFPSLNVYKWDDEVEIFYGWTIYYLLSGDESVYQSAKGVALKYLERAEGDFEHGYYREPFFDTEHTLEGLNMLGALAFVKPDDEEVVQALEDLVEHVGNWVPGYADWFDSGTNHLKSLRPGTTRLDHGCDAGVDWVFNLGFAKLALAAYHATGNSRYLDWVGDYLDGWIQSMERNERENGFYVLPSEVDPATGALGPCSGVWYFPAFEQGWGWQEKGNNANRDMRGAFLDYFAITGDRTYLAAFKRHLMTLFENGSSRIPAHYYDGTSWTARSDKITARMCVQAGLMDPQTDADFDRYLDDWNFNQEDYLMWDYRHNGDMGSILAILNESIKDANRTLEQLQSMENLPAEPDDFPQIREIAGLSLTAFGGVLASRGEMPWTEALYYREDGTLGLESGVAALIERGDDSVKVVLLSNTNDEDRIVELQANFRPAQITRVLVDDAEHDDFFANRARVRVPSLQTIRVELYIFDRDTIAPLPPQDLHLIAATDQSLHIQWSQPGAAEDGDQPRFYKIFRDGEQVGFQDSLDFLDTGLRAETTYEYRIYSVDKAGNVSDATFGTFATNADATPPTVTSVIVADATNLQVDFSEKVEYESATRTGNYLITPGIDVLKAELAATADRVFLTTSPHAENVVYTLQVRDVRDRSPNHNVIQDAGTTYRYASQLAVTDISRENYFESYRRENDVLYSDRNYVITAIPNELQGLLWIVTANDDKSMRDEDFLSFTVNKATTLYIGFDVEDADNGSVPGWLQGWERTDLIIESDDTNFRCYKKNFPASVITLGGNEGDNSSSMYLILLDPQRDVTPPAPPGGLSITLFSN